MVGLRDRRWPAMIVATVFLAPICALAGQPTGEDPIIGAANARAGVATALVDAVEKLAAARGLKEVETDASDVAQPFFAGRGYVAVQRNTVSLNGEWFANTTMKKQLAPGAAQGKPN